MLGAKLAKQYRISAAEFHSKVLQEQREAKLRAARRSIQVALKRFFVSPTIKTDIRVLDMMTAYDYEKSWKYIRRQCLQGTCEWVTKRPEWAEWIQEPVSAGLWCTGSCEFVIDMSESISVDRYLWQWVVEKLSLRESASSPQVTCLLSRTVF